MPYESVSSPASLAGGIGAITPSDTADLPAVTRRIKVTGSAGDITVTWADGTKTTEPVEAGEYLDWRVTRVWSTGTTATGLRGYV